MFKLNKELSRTTTDIDNNDVLNTKFELNKLGYYKPDEKIGMNKFTDDSLFTGIAKFQKDNKLKVDEVMKPNGETEAKINAVKKEIVSKGNGEYNTEKKTRIDLLAPFKDMKQNFDDMNKTNAIGGDKYFHCKGNYQASKRGLYGKAVSFGLSTAKEAKDIFKHGFQDSKEDWEANRDGWNGASKGLTLDEACGKRRPNVLKGRY